MKKNNVIEMHATWLTINSIIGCTNGCKYCFLQSTSHNIQKPEILVNPEEAVNQLLVSKYYIPNIPINLLPNTDPFLNNSNIEYLKKILELLNNKKISNTIIIVSKCYIPIEFINFVKELTFIKNNLVFYLSYSGLDNYIEPNVNHRKIEENFINLFNNNFKIVHYFRPLIPENSTKVKIEEVLTFVKKYTDVSVITGLKLKESFIDKIDFWDEIGNNREAALKSEGVWTESAYDYFYNNYNIEGHHIFQTNSCALAYITGASCLAYYNSRECKECNICPIEQRKLCQFDYSAINYNKLEKKIEKYISKITDQNLVGTYEINEQNNTLTLNNMKLNIGDLSFLTNILNIKVCTNGKNMGDNYFNNSLINAKPLVLSGNMSNINRFLDKYYEKAINLKIGFKKTEPKEWDVMTTLSELTVQIGHIFNVKYKTESFEEKNRKIDNLGDEISDVLLQLCYVAYLEKINLTDIKNHNIYDIKLVPILLGQITEIFMEEKGYRYYKKREGYNTNIEFVEERVRKLFALVFNYGVINGINIEEEFLKMLIDANSFLGNFNV